jgi:hypothetical protein
MEQCKYIRTGVLFLESKFSVMNRNERVIVDFRIAHKFTGGLE